MRPEGFKLDNSVFNSISHTPLKSQIDENKPLVPPYATYKDFPAKFINMPQFMQMNVNSKDNNFKGFNETLDSHQILEEICGKKRSRASSLLMPPGGIIPDASLINSLIYSPSRGN